MRIVAFFFLFKNSASECSKGKKNATKSPRHERKQFQKSEVKVCLCDLVANT